MVEGILRQRWSNKDFSTAFVEFFDLPSHFVSPEAEKLPSYVDIEPLSPDNGPIIAKPLKNLIDYQTQVYIDANKALEVPRSRFIIQMPTGSGKTRTSMEIIANHLKQAPHGSVVFWLAHSSELCEQAYQCFIEVWQYLADKPSKRYDAGVVIPCLNRLRNPCSSWVGSRRSTPSYEETSMPLTCSRGASA